MENLANGDTKIHRHLQTSNFCVYAMHVCKDADLPFWRGNKYAVAGSEKYVGDVIVWSRDLYLHGRYGTLMFIVGTRLASFEADSGFRSN